MNPDLKKTRRKNAAAEPLNTDALPPHSIEAEQGVLGAILLSPKDCLIECAELWGAANVFYDLRHQMIYDAMTQMHGENKLVDLITLQEWLKGRQQLEPVGGFGYLVSLPDQAGNAGHVGSYAQIVWELYQLRQTIIRATAMVRHASEFDPSKGTVEEFLAQCEEAVFNLPRQSNQGAKPVSHYIPKMIDRIEHYARGIGTITGLPTGFRYWDKFSSGLQDTEVICIGGRPGTGKTSLAMNVAERVALDGGNPVGVLSMEMSAEDLVLRLACSRARVNFHKLRTGCASHADIEKITRVMPKVNSAPIYIDDATGLTIFDIRSRLRAMKQRYGIRLGIIDYLQLANLSEKWKGNSVQGYGEVAKGIAASAKELNIPIIVLSQLSRDSEKRGGIPKMSDLRESGDIEGSAHFIGILYRQKMEAEEETEMRETIADDPHAEISIPINLEVCKNRNGPSGTSIMFDFLRWCMRYEDLQNRSKPDEPQDKRSDLPTNEEMGL